MLQWMGGSRRKVYASRKSTLSRQRQYFEQKKRQQQGQGLQNQNDVAGGQASLDQEPRSLDVLNINNLATPDSHHNESANADGAIPQVDCILSEVCPTEALKKITSLCNSNNEEGSQPRLSSPFGHQDDAAAVNSHEESLGFKISPSINCSTRQQNQNLEFQSEISLIDLVSYEGSKNKSTARPAREAHVSFSVKGLGHIKMETPPHSPRSIKRVLPLPPKATRFTHKAKRSIPFDVMKALDSMKSINVLKERRPSDKMDSILDKSDYERRKQFNSYFPDSFKNHNADHYPEDEDMFYEPQAEFFWQSKRSGSNGNLADENSDRLWRIDQFNSEDYFPTPREEHFDTIDYGFKDIYSPERRNSTRSSTRFENTGIPSSQDLFSDHALMDDDEVTEHFEWERHPPSKKVSNSNSIFGPSAWTFDMEDDSEKRRSPLSEESRTSAAAMKDRKCKKPSPAVKNEMNKTDEFHISLDKPDIPNMDAHLHGMSLFNNPEKVDHERTTDQKKLETSYWPERVTEQPRTREPSCRLSLMEKFANWGPPTSHLKGSSGLTNPLSCSVMREDKASFSSAPDLSMYQTVESTEKRPTSQVHSVFHRPDNSIFEDGIHMQCPVSDIFGDNIELSNPFGAKDLQGDIYMSTFFEQKADKKQEDNFATFSNRNADVFPAKKALSSLRKTVGPHITCSQPSGKDSLRHGFSPGFNFQESELNTFWEDRHVSNGTFQVDLELTDLLARKNNDKNEGKIEASEKPDTKMLTETCKLSADHRNEMSGTETCSDCSEVSSYPEAQKETSAAATQIPANLSCLQETSAELFQVHAHVRPGTREKLDNPGVDFEAPLHLRSTIHNVGDHSKRNDMLQSPFVGEEVGIEKKIIASVSPNNSDVQYQFMLEQRVLRRLCVQKIVVATPMKDKLDKDKCFRMAEDGSHVLAKSV
ncbi:uncharacterized protein LOC133897038 [Phragmites australis]|uniref:uncharacterized protein LOC133897038 n=1 Tax=Phragmites australis TaxID=29695 RepID=UPI002D776292|nr:uncharacterized protein LOC133897038 [Phragmites australis]XP_062193616.1 uncharacterized protein LOC133897038 [Phragmites australis]